MKRRSRYQRLPSPASSTADTAKRTRGQAPFSTPHYPRQIYKSCSATSLRIPVDPELKLFPLYRGRGDSYGIAHYTTLSERSLESTAASSTNSGPAAPADGRSHPRIDTQIFVPNAHKLPKCKDSNQSHPDSRPGQKEKKECKIYN